MTITQRVSLALVAAGLSALAGCISVQPLDGIYHCSSDTECPGNYFCDQPSQTCRHAGHPSSSDVDLSVGDDLAGSDSPECHDGVQNGSETDVDCGGGTCPKCSNGTTCKSGNDCVSMFCNKDSLKCVDSQCKDGFKDNGESDIDCGGGSTTMCPTCADGKQCGTTDANCTSGVCNYTTGLCVHTTSRTTASATSLRTSSRFRPSVRPAVARSTWTSSRS